MNLNLVVFNIIYYLVAFAFFHQAHEDPSSSLGVGFLILIFWVFSGIALFVLYGKKIIKVNTIFDKIGIFTATPVLMLCVIFFMSSIGNGGSSESYFDRNNHRYKVVKTDYRGSSQTKSIEYYKSARPVKADTAEYNIDKWLKDSVWVYFSESGSVEKEIRYKDDQKVN